MLFALNLSAQDIELCDNGIDDDGDGLIDCLDDDLANDCCCIEGLIIDLGDDLSTCEGEEVILDAGSGFVSYEWQDGSTDQKLVALGGGTYSIVAIDSCGNIAEDVIVITTNPVYVTNMDYQMCNGGVLDVNGLTYTQQGSFAQELISQEGCDSILVIEISFYADVITSEDYSFCEGEGVNVNGVDYFDEGQFSQSFTDQNGCEGTLFINTSIDFFCQTCGDFSGLSNTSVNVNKVTSDLSEINISKGGRHLFQKTVNKAELSQLILKYTFVNQVKSLKDSIIQSYLEDEKSPLTGNLFKKIDLAQSNGEYKYIMRAIDELKIGYTMTFQ